MEKTSVKQILGMMSQKLGGEENIPQVIKYAEKVAPDLILDVAMSSKSSVGDENSPFDPKIRTLIFLAAALAMKDEECIKAQTKAALNMGATKEELLAVIKIVKHAANSSIIGASTEILKELVEKEQ
jgi:AhpD family alkylhydroperoxidase